MLRAVVVWLNLQVVLLLSRANDPTSTSIPVITRHAAPIHARPTTIYVSHPIPVAAPYSATSTTSTPSTTTHRAAFFCWVLGRIAALFGDIHTIHPGALDRSCRGGTAAVFHHSSVSAQLPLKGTHCIGWGWVTVRRGEEPPTADARPLRQGHDQGHWGHRRWMRLLM